MKKTVLVTGARGRIGSVLCEALAETYDLRLLSSKPIEGVDSIVADIADLDAMIAACKGVDSVVHMAATANYMAGWDAILRNNIVGTYNVYEAAAQAGVPQVIFASSNHAIGTYDLENPAMTFTGQPMLDHLVPVRPDSFYGVSKCFGEVLGRYYADHRSLRVICLRIGMLNGANYPSGGSPEPFERLAAIWLSHRDMVQLVEKSIEAEHVTYDIIYGISNNTHHYYDLLHAEEVLGYVPQDNDEERLAIVRQEIAEGRRPPNPFIPPASPR
jgi:nucleoside-diphosphate-sugar epimerase